MAKKAGPPAALAAAVRATAQQPIPEDQLRRVRDMVRRARDLELEVQDLQAKAAEKGKELTKLKTADLPDIFNEVGIPFIGLDAEGNMPAYEARRKSYYHANIPEERKDEAFAWLVQEGHEDMIKTQISIALGRGQVKMAKAVRAAMDKLGAEYEEKLGVPWNTLTAFVREQIEKYQVTPPLDLLGATVGQVVELKPIEKD